jgi:hypothetical protein
MKVIKLFIAAISCLMISASPQNLSKQCFNSQPNDSGAFGSPLAMSGNYLAVGDPGANKVIIFNRNSDGRWLRTKEILTPKDSIFYKVGSGFGYDVALDRNILAVVALTRDRTSVDQKLIRAIYKVDLDQSHKIERIDTPIKEIFDGINVVADDGKIAFVTSGRNQSRKLISKVDILSANRTYSISNKKYNFLKNLALKSNLLVVGYSATPGGAWLFDLNQPDKKPYQLTITNSRFLTSVAISEQFVVVSLSSGVRELHENDKTLIKSIHSEANTIIDGIGELSLDGNILARLSFSDSFFLGKPKTLELFYIDEQSIPYRFQMRQAQFQDVLIKNNLLTTVQQTESSDKLCIESIF